MLDPEGFSRRAAVTAILRETREEMGLDLARAGRLLGHPDHMNVNPIGTGYRMLHGLFAALDPSWRLTVEATPVNRG